MVETSKAKPGSKPHLKGCTPSSSPRTSPHEGGRGRCNHQNIHHSRGVCGRLPARRLSVSRPWGSPASAAMSDGFGNEVNGVRYWTGYQEPQVVGPVHLFKLHGSVDWFDFRPDEGDPFYDDRIGVLVGDDPWHTNSPEGRLQMCLSGRPILVIGTFNKYVTYTSELIANIHHAWRSALKMSNRLVVCGYGFGDKGINAQIIDWVYGARNRRLLVISPNIESLRARARGAIAYKWDNWSQAGVMESIESKLEDVSCDQFTSFFDG